MFRGSILSVVVAIGLLPLGLRGADNTLYELVVDFPTEKNPDGPWTIGTYNHTFSGKVDDLQNLTTYGKLTFTKIETPCGSKGGVRGWGKISSGFLGLGSSATGVVKNTATTTQYSIPAGGIGVFPQYGPVVVRWTAPNDGNLSVRGKFVNLTDNAGFPEVWVIHNQDLSSPIHYQAAKTSTGKASKTGDHIVPEPWKCADFKKSPYQGAVTVAAKDTIDFVIDPMYTVCDGHSEHSDGNGTDTIGLSAVIGYVTDTSATK